MSFVGRQKSWYCPLRGNSPLNRLLAWQEEAISWQLW